MLVDNVLICILIKDMVEVKGMPPRDNMFGQPTIGTGWLCASNIFSLKGWLRLGVTYSNAYTETNQITSTWQCIVN